MNGGRIVVGPRFRRRLEVAKVTDACVLEQGGEDHDEAGDEEDIDALQVGDLGKGGVRAGDEGRHR